MSTGTTAAGIRTIDPLVVAWQERVREAASASQPLRPRGGGSKDFYGGFLGGEIFDTREYAGIVAFEPTELVVTLRCGTPLAELNATLAEAGQCLPFEPPAFGAATVGGMLAAGLSGPARMRSGALRDYVLGVRLIDGRGDLLRFGGEVIKNVAGYDVSRVIAGSLGTLGVLTEVSLKVLPRAAAGLTQVLELPVNKAIALMNQLGGRPLPLSASAWHAGQLTVRLAGAAPAVAAAGKLIGGEPLSDADAFWASLGEQSHPFFSAALAGQKNLWRVSVPSAAELPTDSASLIEWGGALRWLCGDFDARTLQNAARAVGGSVACFRSASEAGRAFAFPARAPAIAAIESRLKKAFDPAGIFSPGRMNEAVVAETSAVTDPAS